MSLGRGHTEETVNACSVASTEVLAFNLVWTMQLVFIIPSVTFPSHILEHIGIFHGWMQLTKITIGSTLKSLGHYFFFFYRSFYSLHGTHSDFVLPLKRNHTCFSWINSNFKIKKSNFQIHLPPQRLHCYIPDSLHVIVSGIPCTHSFIDTYRTLCCACFWLLECKCYMFCYCSLDLQAKMQIFKHPTWPNNWSVSW